MKANQNKVGGGQSLDAAPSTTPQTRNRDHFAITTAQLRDKNFDKRPYLEWLGGVNEANRVTRIMLPFLVVAVSSKDTTKSPLNKIA